MRIGIITFHDSLNYGAVLQSFALVTYLRKLGYEAEIIDYRFVFDAKKYRIIRWQKIYDLSYLKSDLLSLRIHLSRKLNFKSFKANYLHLSTFRTRFVCLLKKFCSKYDVIICGSDQIWNFRNIGNKVDSVYFLNFLDNGVFKIAYGASMGDLVSFNSSELKEAFCASLNNINVVSFREQTTLNVVKEILPQKSLSLVPDPVFLFDSNYYSSLSKSFYKINANKKPYVLIYAIGGYKNNLDWVSTIIEVFERRRIHIVRLIDNKNLLTGRFKDSIDVSGCHPLSFISYIYNAEYVVTNSFHGTVFSSLFNKSFISVGKQGIESSIRFNDLLYQLGLSDRFIPKSNITVESINKILNEMDNFNYDKVNQRIARMRESGKDFLEKSLNMAIS